MKTDDRLKGEDFNTVCGLAALKACFDPAAFIGVDINFLLRLRDLSKPEPADSQAHTSGATDLLHVINAKYDDPAEGEKAFGPINSHIDEVKRDALAGFMIWNLGKTFSHITSLQDLYEFLLIDVEMTGCADISYVKQGLNSLQLYIQRCRMGIEAEVKSQIPEKWWAWMAHYRVWEASRKVFLYPENYIDPSLRKIKTPLYQELEDELLQGDITDETVTAAYTNYFDKFEELAKLKIVDSYYCTVDNPTHGASENTLFLFARTRTTPYTYYYRTAVVDVTDEPTVKIQSWRPWQKIDLTINAETVSPV